MPAKRKADPSSSSTANLGFEAKLWLAADTRKGAEIAEANRSNDTDAVNTFRRDLHPDLRADYILANPPFNDYDTALRANTFVQTGGHTAGHGRRTGQFPQGRRRALAVWRSARVELEQLSRHAPHL